MFIYISNSADHKLGLSSPVELTDVIVVKDMNIK